MLILTEFHVPLSQVYASLFIVLVLSIVAIIIGLKIKKLDPKNKTPKWMVPMLMLVDAVNNIAKENFGRRWKAVAPYFLTLAIFILFSNIIGVIGIPNPTSYIVINAFLAMTAFFLIQITGVVSLGPKKYLKGFIEPIPVMLPINLISEFTLPLSLSLRLLGNILSGSVVGMIVKGLVAINPWLIIVVIPGTLVVNLILDLFGGVIQTLVFILLTSTFAGMKVSDEDKVLVEEKVVQNNEMLVKE